MPNVPNSANRPPEPHAPSGFSALLRWLPGFAGYLKQEDRARSDVMQRDWLADRLQRGKQGLERYARALVDAVQLDSITTVDRLRLQTDQLVGRIRGAVRGGGAFFGDAVVASARLDEVYALDLSLIEQVASVADAMEQLGAGTADAERLLAQIASGLDQLSQAWDAREDRLKE